MNDGKEQQRIVSQRAARFHVENPACKNCHVGHHELDGDYGEIDCGWWCGLKDEETDPDALCVLWLPDFWETQFADEIGGNDPESVTQSMLDASEKYHSAISKEPKF